MPSTLAAPSTGTGTKPAATPPPTFSVEITNGGLLLVDGVKMKATRPFSGGTLSHDAHEIIYQPAGSGRSSRQRLPSRGNKRTYALVGEHLQQQ